MNRDMTLQYDLSQVEQVAKKLVQKIKNVSVVTFVGSLGVGKTTLVGAMLRNMGVSKPVTSPTFTYMNMYELADGRIAYHFDLYRLDSLEAFEQAGFTDYLYQENSICLIEWPEVVDSLLTYSVGRVVIDFIGMDKRQLTYVETR